MSLMTEVQTLLSGVSGLYVGYMPDTPDNAVAIYNTGGYARDMSGSAVEEPTFQVRVRNASYAAVEIVCRTVMEKLHRKNATKLLMIQSQSAVLDLGRDDSNRPEWSMNFRCYYVN